MSGKEMDILAEYLESYSGAGVRFLNVENKKEHAKPKQQLLDELKEQELGKCTLCDLHRARNNIVFGQGNPDALLMFIGEAPGGDEDMQGMPFVGKAGQLLTKIIEAIKLKRKDVYIANILKCRPPNNRDPEPGEIELCKYFLQKQIDIIRPGIICTLGRIATGVILGNDMSISKARGRFHKIGDMLVMPTYHPSYLLRNPSGKRPVWEDMKLIRKEYDRLLNEKGV